MIKFGLREKAPEPKRKPDPKAIKAGRRELVGDLAKIAFGVGGGLSLGYLGNKAERYFTSGKNEKKYSSESILRFINDDLDKLDEMCLRNRPPERELSASLEKAIRLSEYIRGCRNVYLALAENNSEGLSNAIQTDQALKRSKNIESTLKIKLYEQQKKENPPEGVPIIRREKGGIMNT